MNYEEFRKWCSDRTCDDCWGMNESIICCNIIDDIDKTLFWKREKKWKEMENEIVITIVEPINKKITELQQQSKRDREIGIQEKIKDILNDVKIDRTLNGYYLWIELIKDIYENYTIRELSKIKITEYYLKLAAKNKTTYVAVERSLRFCIENRKDTIINYFKYYDKKITNKKFLILVIERLCENSKKVSHLEKTPKTLKGYER